MLALNITMHEIGDPEPIIKEGGAVEVEISQAAILERGTAAGDTSLSLIFKGPDGKTYFGQMTGNIFRGLNSAFTGADTRFKEKQAKKN